MKKKIIISSLMFILLFGGVSMASTIFEEDIAESLVMHKNELVINLSQAESNAIAYYMTELESFKLSEIERGKSLLDSAFENEVKEIDEEFKNKHEEDKKELSKFVDAKVKELTAELRGE